MLRGHRTITLAFFVSTLTFFGAGALKPDQKVSGHRSDVSIQSNTAIYQPLSIPPVAIMTPDNCSAPFPISPMITLPSGQTISCPAQAQPTTVSSSPQLPPPC